MIITQSTLLALGVFATLATIGMFLQYGDDATRPLVGFTAAIAWTITSITSFNVSIVRDSTVYEVELTAIVYFAGALAFITFLFTLRLLLVLVGQSAEDSNFDPFAG